MRFLKRWIKRRLLFWIDAHDELEKVAEGEHERVLVSREKISSKNREEKTRDFDLSLQHAKIDPFPFKGTREDSVLSSESCVPKRDTSDEIGRRRERMKRFEILDHTADIGLMIYGNDLKSLFEHAGEGFFHLITDLKKVKPRIERRVELNGEGPRAPDG